MTLWIDLPRDFAILHLEIRRRLGRQTARGVDDVRDRVDALRVDRTEVEPLSMKRRLGRRQE